MLPECVGFAGCAHIADCALERVIDCSAEIDQHTQGLAGRIFGVEHDFPGLANHAQPADRFFGTELGAAAIDRGYRAVVEFTQAILNGVEIVLHQAEECPPNHEAETRESDHGRGIEITGRVLRFEFASLFESAAVQ